MSVSTFEINQYRDLTLIDGKNLGMVTDQTAMVNIIMHRCLMRKGENIFDIADGLDYFGTIFNSSPDLITFRIDLIDRILDTPDVVSVENLEITKNNDIVSYTARIVTDYGVTVTQFSAKP